MSNKNEICKIIKACGEHGVKSIEFDGVKIVFQDDVNVKNENTFLQNTTPQYHESFIGQTNDEDAFVEEDLERDTQNQFETLMIENPSLYEELLASDKLESYGEPHAES